MKSLVLHLVLVSVKKNALFFQGPAAPTNLKATKIAAREATLSWSPAGSASKAMHYRLYQVCYKISMIIYIYLYLCLGINIIT